MRVHSREHVVRAAARILALATALVGSAAAASAQSYTISWWTVDANGFNGATTSPPGRSFYTTAGQPDAGGPFPGATFTVRSGYWSFVAGSGGGLESDLAVTVNDGLATAVPGMPVSYTMTVSNAGPHAASGAWVVNPIGPLSLQNVSWTCSASPGSSCPPSGTTQPPSHFVDVAPGGQLTYSLIGTIPPPMTGNLVNTISATVAAGATDPNPANNSATDTDQLTPRTDMGVAVVDTPDPVGPGLPYGYTITVRNNGPSYSTGSTLTTVLPSNVIYMGSQGTGGSCSHASGTVTCDMAVLDAGAAHTVNLRAQAPMQSFGQLDSTMTVVGDEVDLFPPNDVFVENTMIGMRAQAGLTHGAKIVADLAAAGAVADADFYRVRQDPYSSYEVVLDAASGDTGTNGPELWLLATDGLTAVASGASAGTGSSLSMRWLNDTSATIDGQFVRVRSSGSGCQHVCGADDQYRVRLWDTTGVIPRYNSTGSQVTVVIVQNTTPDFANARMYFWDPSGNLLFRQSVSLAPFAQHTLNTNGFQELQNTSGSITVASDAPLGTIVGKAVSLEPSTGFSFDTPMTTRPR